MGFPGGSAGKESACNVEDLGRSPGEGRGYPLQYSGLENSMDRLWGRKQSDTTEATEHTRMKELLTPIHPQPRCYS